jgi:hypothetical protein
LIKPDGIPSNDILKFFFSGEDVTIPAKAERKGKETFLAD